MTLEELMKQSRAEQESWKSQVNTVYIVKIERNGQYFDKVFIPKEEGTLECLTVDEIKSLAIEKNDKVFKHTTTVERIK